MPRLDQATGSRPFHHTHPGTGEYQGGALPSFGEVLFWSTGSKSSPLQNEHDGKFDQQEPVLTHPYLGNHSTGIFTSIPYVSDRCACLAMMLHPLLYIRQSFSIPHAPGIQPLPPPRLFDESRAADIVAGNVLLQLVGTLFFVLRIYSRLWLTKSWKVEDSLLTIAWVFATAFSTCQYGQVAHGAGHHLGVVLHNDPKDAVESQKWAYAANLILFPALAFPKLSICDAYSRIFGESLMNRRMIYALIVLVAIPNIPFFFLSVFQCTPIHVYWTEGRPFEKCHLIDFKMFYIHGGLNIFCDVALMIIVMPRVLELHVGRRQKWALVGIVGLGSLAVIAGIVRMTRLSLTLSKPNFDASWDAYDVSIWTSTEIYVSLICAAAPGIKPVVSLVLPKLLGSSLGSRARTTTGDGHGGAAPIELHSKMRRATIGSARTRRNTHESILDEADGPYAEVGRGVDTESLGSKEVKPARRHTKKVSEILIIQSNAV
ncbi:uncharacterized protein CC84DRAFT_302083 [Paraphaeosphaeria sporulosa]|uniref:Rhodopsin domain-containing protein n=1 Tax=Paraphaeosphaeria sporulosa TaxID=1460663 RepID=A0A177C0V6_9PLEO|nr:uncharacterized protein CC84DRAFT_302083 [Paraphaeosphaeria sporulosa]OAG00438.1 hypothetical protein CC84DRAFT_302083 [Paraphaeosphaeria sporulosa]